jgi:hypothetical protein
MRESLNDYCRMANEEVMVIAHIEDIEAIQYLGQLFTYSDATNPLDKIGDGAVAQHEFRITQSISEGESERDAPRLKELTMKPEALF